jgi:hypothetical protein
MKLADDLSRSLTGSARTEPQSILGRIMFQNAFHPSEPDTDAMFNLQTRDPGLARLVINPAGGAPPVPDGFQDVTFYDRIPLSPHSLLELPSAPGGLSAWLRDPVAAAAVGAPDIGLSNCPDASTNH